MKHYSITEKKNIEHLAINTANVKDYGKKGLNNNNAPKKGFYQLKDMRVIKLSEIFQPSNSSKKTDPADYPFDIAEKAKKHQDELRNLKGIGYDSNSKQAKPGFYLCENGKVISLKNLAEIVNAESQTDQKDNTNSGDKNSPNDIDVNDPKQVN